MSFHRRFGVRGAEMKVRTGSAAVGVTRERTLTDQALAPATGLHGDDCIAIIPVAVGCVVERHPRTVVVPPVIGDRIAAGECARGKAMG